jgi:hypothetical protein
LSFVVTDFLRKEPYQGRIEAYGHLGSYAVIQQHCFAESPGIDQWLVAHESERAGGQFPAQTATKVFLGGECGVVESFQCGNAAVN